MTEARKYLFLPQFTTAHDYNSLPTPFGLSSPPALAAPPPSRIIEDITQGSYRTHHHPNPRRHRFDSDSPRVRHTRPLPHNIYLQTCFDWTTTWTANPTLLALLPHRPLFPALLKTLSDFRCVGFRISRLLFIHKRRIANAPHVAICACGSCNKESSCSLDWTEARAFVKICLDVEAKFAKEMALLKYVKPYIDDQLAFYMINLAAGPHPIIVGSGSAEDALYSFDQWWRCTADEVVGNLELLIKKLRAQTPVLGKVETEEVMSKYETDPIDECHDTPTQSLKKELDHIRYSSPVEDRGEEDKGSCDTIICYPPPREEGLVDKGMYTGRRLFQEENEDHDEGGMEVPIVLDVVREMGPPEKQLQDGFEPAEVSSVLHEGDKRILSGKVWWKAPTV